MDSSVSNSSTSCKDKSRNHSTVSATDYVDFSLSLSKVDDVGNKKDVVILIVGNKVTDKNGVVDSLTGNGTWDDRLSAGTRILTCHDLARVIVDTTPLVNVDGRSPTAISRRWISRNGLRRHLLEKDVVVVCVVTCRVTKTCKWDTFNYSNCWVDVFGLTFKEHKQKIMILVNTEGKNLEDISEGTRHEVERFVEQHGFPPKNITYAGLKGGESCVGTVLDEIICQRKTALNHSFRSRTRHNRTDKPAVGGKPLVPRAVVPFSIDWAVSSEKEKFGPWGYERVILFGRTGSGKSTLAQMLTLGNLDRDNKTFVPNSGVRGGTKEVQPGTGRGWYVLDTPGFGEPAGAQSTISTSDVEKKIKDYVRIVEGTFSHYIYVVKKDRLDGLEERLWKFFMLLFGKEIKQQFTVVVSGADDDWIEQNKTILEKCFKDCSSFLAADFPAADESDDEELEIEYRDMRTESLLKLEEKLARLSRVDMHCKYGKSSKMQTRAERDRANMDLGIEKSERIKFLVRGASMVFTCCTISERPFSELTNLLKVDDDIKLIPM